MQSANFLTVWDDNICKLMSYKGNWTANDAFNLDIKLYFEP